MAVIKRETWLDHRAFWTSLLAATLCLLLMTAPARAQSIEMPSVQGPSGESEEDLGPGFIDRQMAAGFSRQIEQELASRGARVGIVFRTGRDREKLPSGIRYTHGAFWVYQPIQLSDGRVVNGYAVYNLYNAADDPRASYLKQDFPFDFTRPMAIAEAGLIVPTPAMQERIIAVMASPDYQALHQPVYSLISNPHDPRYQNCNEFMLDVVAAALWETADRAQLKSNLRAHYTPAKIQTNLLQRIFAPMVDDRLVTEDHRGAVRTTTFRSMGEFMEANGLADAVLEISYTGAEPAPAP